MKSVVKPAEKKEESKKEGEEALVGLADLNLQEEEEQKIREQILKQVSESESNNDL